MVADGAHAHDALQRSPTGARCLYHPLERPQHTAEQSLRTVGCNMASPAAAAAEASGPDGTMFDYPVIEEMDPSLAGGYQLFYEREVPLELRSATTVDNPTEVGALEAIKVKILVRTEGDSLKSIKIELCSESNLFFHYVHELDAASFKTLQESQRLMISFPDYPAVLLRMLNQCVREPHVHLAVLLMQPNGEARMDFIQNMEYKFVELLSCRFLASKEDVVRQQVSYRYNLVKARLALMQARLADVNSLIKIKSPSLMLQLQRTPPRMPGSGPPGGRPFRGP